MAYLRGQCIAAEQAQQRGTWMLNRHRHAKPHPSEARIAARCVGCVCHVALGEAHLITQISKKGVVKLQLAFNAARAKLVD